MCLKLVKCSLEHYFFSIKRPINRIIDWLVDRYGNCFTSMQSCSRYVLHPNAFEILYSQFNSPTMIATTIWKIATKFQKKISKFKSTIFKIRDSLPCFVVTILYSFTVHKTRIQFNWNATENQMIGRMQLSQIAGKTYKYNLWCDKKVNFPLGKKLN